MSLLSNLLRSLLITGMLSFLAPAVLVGVIWVLLLVVGYVPYLDALQQMGIEQLLHFLQIFGNGSPLQGVIIIGLVCSSVGILFDTYTFYRYQKLNN